MRKLGPAAAAKPPCDVIYFLKIFVISTETNEVSGAEKSQNRDFSTAFAVAHSAQNDKLRNVIGARKRAEKSQPQRCRKATYHARLAALITYRVAVRQLISPQKRHKMQVFAAYMRGN